jgi:hypothetical protein
MTKRALLLLCCLAIGVGTLAYADEGMWLFNAFPKDKVQAKYGWAPDQAWLDHVQLSSARAPNGSSSFVSPDGLIFTNHHIAQECIHDLSTGGKDYMKDGFYAATQADEAKCPGMEFVVLQGIEDVTAKVNGAVKPGMSVADAGRAQRQAMASLEKDCSSGGIRCDVVTLYSGAMYNLYKYKKYDDIRLVFAPEFSIAFFGGDPDNFEYPRYDLDVAFFRVYENGKPAQTPQYLKWQPKGASDGELIFVSGHPGRTQRLFTMDQILSERDVRQPLYLDLLKTRITALKQYASQGPEQARQVTSMIFSLENSQKAFRGEYEALLDKQVLSKKQAEEDEFRKKIAANSQWQAEFGSAWNDIAVAEQKGRVLVKQQLFRRLDSQLASMALQIVQYAAEIKKPDGERLTQFHEAGLESFRFRLLSPAPIYPAV